MSNVTIQEEYVLPSLGKVYREQFDPSIKLRSMTVAEEMRRLTKTDYPYKTMSEIIDDCLETKLPISAYDMCLGDYQFLLHRLRVVTYGPNYDMSVMCRNCGNIFTYTVNLDDLPVFEYDESVDSLYNIKLPVTGKSIEIGFQTPRDLDYIEKEKRELAKKFPDMKYDPTMMLNLETLIKSVDGEQLGPTVLREMVKKLPMGDSNIILQQANKLNEKVGIDINLSTTCPNCEGEVLSTFRFTSEFFRPTNY